MTNNTSTTLAAALAYAAHGLPVFPCLNEPTDPKQHKRPLTKNGFKDAKTDADAIRRWWRRWPDALIGMPTGASSGVAVLDLDTKNGKNGFVAVRRCWRARRQAERTSTIRRPARRTVPVTTLRLASTRAGRAAT